MNVLILFCSIAGIAYRYCEVREWRSTQRKSTELSIGFPYPSYISKVYFRVGVKAIHHLTHQCPSRETTTVSVSSLFLFSQNFKHIGDYSDDPYNLFFYLQSSYELVHGLGGFDDYFYSDPFSAIERVYFF